MYAITVVGTFDNTVLTDQGISVW